jgi:SAM-dependent methyltransferase
VDLSVRACDLGARRRPELGWIVSNADRVLPFFDASFGLVLSAVGPKNPGELRRLLRPGGALVLLLSAPDDLIELRAAAQGEGRLLERVGPTLERFAPWFTCVERASARTRIRCERADLEDLLATTYRGARAR